MLKLWFLLLVFLLEVLLVCSSSCVLDVFQFLLEGCFPFGLVIKL
jgi:hypothetical protein